LAGKSVLLATGSQLTAGLALIELDGIAPPRGLPPGAEAGATVWGTPQTIPGVLPSTG